MQYTNRIQCPRNKTFKIPLKVQASHTTAEKTKPNKNKAKANRWKVQETKY